MNGRALFVASFCILAALGIGIVVGERLGEQVGRAETMAALSPDIAANRCAVAALGDRIERLSETAYLLTASWYGPGFQGRPTSSGAIFDQDDFTVAHRTLPFGTVLKIENPANGKRVLAIVTDRGPFIDGRELDLSRGCAERLGIIEPGVAPVAVRVIR